MNSVLNLIKAIRSRGLAESLKKLVALVRGLLISFRISKVSKILARGRTIIIKRNGTIKIGDYTTLWPMVKLSCNGSSKREKALIQIGRRCSIGDRTEVHSGKNVTIGDDVIIGWDCVVTDRDYHSVDGGNEVIKPVIIEDNVWIACRSIILKGVTIGKSSVIAAGSVVTRDVPPNSLVVGNPAKEIKKVKGWR